MPDTEEDLDLSLRWEDVFDGDEAVKIELEVWENQKATIEIEANEFAPSRVSHGFIEIVENDIAYSLIERPGEMRPLIVHCGGNTAARKDSGTPYGLKLIEFGDASILSWRG